MKLEATMENENRYLQSRLKRIQYVKEYIHEIKNVWIVGQQDARISFIGRLLEKFDVCTFAITDAENWKRNFNEAQKLLLKGEIDGIIIADAYCVTGYEKALWLTEKLERIFEVSYALFRINEKDITEAQILEIFLPVLQSGRIGEVQFNLTDKCNLNCDLCSHFSPLVKQAETYTVEQFVKDAKRINALTEHVDVVGLWGGESLLHEKLEEIIYEARKIFPDSRIEVGTNGLLIPKMSVRLLTAIKKCRCKVVVSGYPPTLKMWDEIKDMLECFDILYRMTKVDQFFKRYELEGKNNPEETYAVCCSKVCHTVINGRFSSCYFPIAAHIFNDHFGNRFEVEDSIYDLYGELDMLSFTRKIKSAVNACRYCGEMSFENWKVCSKKDTEISDWVRVS